MEIINVGIIGCGGITAFTHVPQLIYERNKTSIRYLCDININRANIIKERYNVHSANCTVDPNIIFNDSSIDAVIISAWPTFNLQLGLQAIKCKKHTLIQKPLIASSSETKELITLVYKSKLHVLALPYIELLSPFVKCKEIIASGRLGKINFAKIRTTIPGPADYCEDVNKFFIEEQIENPYKNKQYANNRGALSDMGPYALSVFHYLFGTGKLNSSSLYPKKFEDVALLNLSSENIPNCSIEIAWNQIRGIEIFSIYGSEGTACMKTDGSIQVILKKGIIEEYCTGNLDSLSVMLPVSPFDAQKKWIDTIHSDTGYNLNHTVERAIWVSQTIDEAYNIE